MPKTRIYLPPKINNKVQRKKKEAKKNAMIRISIPVSSVPQEAGARRAKPE
jgi:hypothetical protein